MSVFSSTANACMLGGMVDGCRCSLLVWLLAGTLANASCSEADRSPPRNAAGASGAGNDSGAGGSDDPTSGRGGGPSVGGTSSTHEPSSGASGVGDAGAGGEGGSSSCQCDDAVACTRDACENGACRHAPDHALCESGDYCDPARDCQTGASCARTADCARPDACVTVECDAETRRCAYSLADEDLDGESPVSCGGTDCDDAEGSTSSRGIESCNGRDDDCDGVVDPPEDSGCGAGRVCELECVCAAPLSECTSGAWKSCVDLATDSDHCGACGVACGSRLTCEGGECRCPAGLDRCGNSACTDFQSDPANCGECGRRCGNGECVEGECRCPGSLTDCGSSVLNCVDTTSSVEHCGGCQQTCLPGGTCSGARCDTDVQSVSLFGTPAPPYATADHELTIDGEGNSYVAMNMDAGSYQRHPGGGPVLWTSAVGIAKFDANGELVWHVPLEPKVGSRVAIAPTVDGIWASVSVNANHPSLTIGQETFVRRDDYAWLTIIAKLSAESGEIAEFHRVDLDYDTAQQINMSSDRAGDLWIHGVSGASMYLDGSPFPRHESKTIFVHEVGTATTHWLNGELLPYLKQTPTAEDFVVTVSPRTIADFTLGGRTFDLIATGWSPIIARFSKDFKHRASFLSPIAVSLVPRVEGVAALRMDERDPRAPFVRVYDYAGNSASLVRDSGDLALHVRLRGSATGAGSTVYACGDLAADSIVGSRYLPAARYKGFVAGYDVESMELTHLVGLREIPHDCAVSADGSSLTVIAPFVGGVTVGPEAIPLDPNTSGLMVLKLRLNR